MDISKKTDGETAPGEVESAATGTMPQKSDAKASEHARVAEPMEEEMIGSDATKADDKTQTQNSVASMNANIQTTSGQEKSSTTNSN